MFDGWRRRAARAFAELTAPATPPGYTFMRMEIPEFEAMRLVQALRANLGNTEELERLREERFELEDLARRQAEHIEELEKQRRASEKSVTFPDDFLKIP